MGIKPMTSSSGGVCSTAVIQPWPTFGVFYDLWGHGFEFLQPLEFEKTFQHYGTHRMIFMAHDAKNRVLKHECLRSC